MADIDELFASNAPIVWLCGLDDSSFCNLVWQVNAKYAGARVCRGAKMKTFNSLYDEISAAFQFPYYFGFNLDALVDCLSELSWIDAENYLLCVSDFDLVLSTEPPGALARFFDCLKFISDRWEDSSSDSPDVRQAQARFRILLQVAPGAEHEAMGKLSRSCDMTAGIFSTS